MARNEIGFSSKTFGATKIHIKKDILTALESDRDMRREISRVFQQANRRIQNVEKSGTISPAVISLNKGDIKGFTKFSMKHDWEDLKIEYAKAVSFLRQPTSTATGAREYAKHLQTAYKLSDDEFSLMQDKLMDKVASVSDERFLEQYLMQYKDFTGELEREAKDVSDQIEDEALRLANAITQNFDDTATQGENAVNEAVRQILDSFKNFGL